MVDLKILQSERLRAFRPISQKQDLSQDLSRNPANKTVDSRMEGTDSGMEGRT